MSVIDDNDVEQFGTLFREFLEQVVHAAQGVESPLIARLQVHLGADPRGLPVRGAAFAPFEHPDVQLAIEAYVAEPGRRHESPQVSTGSTRTPTSWSC